MMWAMTKTLSIELAYDAPLAAVSAMLADPAFRDQVCDAQHATSRTITVGGIPGTVEVEMTQLTRGVPAFASKFVGSEVTVRQAETWSSPAAATVRIDSGVSIARIEGTFALAERAGRTVETIALTIAVKVPLVGGKLEALVADLMQQAFTKEGEVGTAYLAG
jgi:hypothetical protein